MDIQKFNKLLTRTRPEELSALEREMLWRQVRERSSGARFMPRMALFTTPLSRTAIVGSCVAALVYGGALTVYASDDAVPGDLLYPVDTMVEKLQIAVVPKQQRDQLLVKFGEERLREVEHVFEEEYGISGEHSPGEDSSDGDRHRNGASSTDDTVHEKFDRAFEQVHDSIRESEEQIESDDSKDELRKIKHEVESLQEKRGRGKRSSHEQNQRKADTEESTTELPEEMKQDKIEDAVREHSDGEDPTKEEEVRLGGRYESNEGER